MTQQEAHAIKYKNKNYEIADAEESVKFLDLADYGIVPHVFSTSCWSGHLVNYVVKDEYFLVNRLLVGVGEDPARLDKVDFFGSYPTKGTRPDTVIYRPDNARLNISGRMVIGRTIDRNHRSDFFYYHPSQEYLEVFELQFDEGHLIEAIDKTQELAEFKKTVKWGLSTQDEEFYTWSKSYLEKFEGNYRGRGTYEAYCNRIERFEQLTTDYDKNKENGN